MSTEAVIRGILKDARELVRDGWTTTNLDVPFEEACGAYCASVAISAAAAKWLVPQEVVDAAHFAYLRGIGVTVPADHTEKAYEIVYAHNDAQPDRDPVVAAFDKAIELLGPEPTPQADATLRVMAACDDAGKVVAEHIVSEHPGMDLVEVQALASAELFYAAQDAARVCNVEAQRA